MDKVLSLSLIENGFKVLEKQAAEERERLAIEEAERKRIEDERKERTYLFKNIKLNDGRNLYPNDITVEETVKFLKANLNYLS